MAPSLADELTDLATSWRRALRVAELADMTIKTYTQSLKIFTEWVRERPELDSLDDLNRHVIEDWLLDMKAKGLKSNTRATRHRNVRTFFRWLVREDELTVSPLDNVPQPKIFQQPVDVVPLDDIRKLLATCKGTDLTQRRDEAIIRSLADAGMRVSECTGLALDDVDMDLQVFTVRGKGNRLRGAPFSARTATAVDRYLRIRRRQKHASSPALWISRQGTLGAERVRKMLDERCELAGLEHLHPHQFRHTLAHHLRLGGMNDTDMMRIFGWRTSAMLARYGESAADERALAAFDRFNIGDKL